MSTISAFTGAFDLRLVLLSVSIAVLASFAALDLAGRITIASGLSKASWLAGGAVAMGTGIWAMHYIGMVALRLPIEVLYDWPTVVLSLACAIAASGIALYLVSRPTMGPYVNIVGSIFMGGGIAAMHYIGMAAMRISAICVYSKPLVVLSIILAFIISFGALKIAFTVRYTQQVLTPQRIGASILMGAAISSMHYVGMAAVHFVPTASIQESLAHAVGVSAFALTGVVATTLIILTVVFISSAFDKRFYLQAQKLAESQSHLSTIFNTVAQGILVLDPEGKIVTMNKAARQLFPVALGANFHLAIAKRHQAFTLDGFPVPPDLWPAERAIHGEYVQNRELMFRNLATGETTVREITTAPLPGGKGQENQILLTYRDNTERRRGDEVRNQLAAIVESSDDAIIGMDLKGFIQSWNRGADRIFGYSASEMIGKSIKRLLPPDRKNEEDEVLRRILRNASVEHFDTVRVTKNGDLIDVSLTISPIKDSTGTIIGASKIARDITQTKLLGRQFIQSQKLEAVGQLTGGIAHDFNNILGVIMGNLDLLERLDAGNPTALKRIHTAQRAAVRAADLTRRLLAFSSKEDLRPAPTQINDSIQNIIELARQAIGPEITITTRFQNDLPTALVDGSSLESAILNLVVNARDAMPKGGSITIATSLAKVEEPSPSVKSGDLKVGTYVRISVSDNGIGMAKEIIERACEPFFTTKPRGKGTGLGLPMVYGFVKQSGGTVRIYSEVGYGTTVTVFLPLAGEESNDVPMVAPPPKNRAGRVLVVDDEVDLLEIASSYISDLGYIPIEARNGFEAIEIISSRTDIDLILTDIIMGGGMNGVELVQIVRQLCPNVKVIYCSGFHADALAERNMPVADAPMLHKPFQRSEFDQVVRQVMEPSLAAAE